MRIQILSSRVGGGHQSVAQALRDGLASLDEPAPEVWVDDLYLQLARFPASRFPWMYATMTRRLPRAWRLVFNVTNRPPSGPRLNWVGDVVGGPALARLLAARRPDAVVTVLPGTTGFVARSVVRSGIGAGVEVVVTDWADVHLGWASTFEAHYTVPTDDAATTFLSVGIPPEHVTVSGFLLREHFARAQPGPAARRAARERLGLAENAFVVLVMVGAEGSPSMLAYLRALAVTPLNADILVLCGHLRRFRRRVERLDGPNRLEAFGFVDYVADLMLAADLLITKAGGVTLAEAFACGVPVVVFDPLPGQEEGNVRYVTSRGAAELATTPHHLATLAAELAAAPARRRALAEAGRALSRPEAAVETARAIVARAASRHQ